MRTALRALVGCVALAMTCVYFGSEWRLRRRYEVPAEVVVVPEDPAGLARGRHVAVAIGQCTYCHGDDLGGKLAVDEPALGRLYAPNLTAGGGGIGAGYTDADFVRAIRHGVDPRGRPLVIMPAQYLRSMTDADLGALIAYMRSAPPVDRVMPRRRVGPLTRLVLVSGQAPELLPAELIDHSVPPVRGPEPRLSAAYGKYLVDLAGCRVCHKPDLSGGLHPLSVQGEPPPPNLTPGGRLTRWSRTDFFRALRAGMTPDGRLLNHNYMPWLSIGQMSDLEIQAVWRYLESLPALASSTE